MDVHHLKALHRIVLKVYHSMLDGKLPDDRCRKMIHREVEAALPKKNEPTI